MTRLLSILLLSCLGASGATYCVGPSASGNGSGSDWTNCLAWTATPARGDTWLLKGGSYTGKTFTTAASGSTGISILSYTGGVAFTSSLRFDTSNWLLDGVTGGGTNASAYGMSVAANNFRAFYVGELAGDPTITNITIAHVYYTNANYLGTYSPYFLTTLPCVQFINMNSNLIVGCETFLHLEPNALADQHHISVIGNCILNSWIADSDHMNGICIYCGACGLGMSYLTVANNLFRGLTVSGVGGAGGSNWIGPNGARYDHVDVYGNVFDSLSQGYLVGAITMNGCTMNYCRMVNNTVVNCGSSTCTWFNGGVDSGGGDSVGNVCYNNLLVGNLQYNGGYALKDYNTYVQATSNGYDGSHTQTTNSFPLSGYIPTQDSAAGTNLGSPFNVDPNGVQRTTRGAFQYGAAPNAPASFQAFLR